MADIFEALTADHPYRRPIPKDTALAIMAADTGTGIDADCFAALKRVVDPPLALEPKHDRRLASAP